MNASGQIHCDVLVVGSGAGGLATAVTAAKGGLDVVVAEKDSAFGGTTARSGGWLWIPCNPHASREGIEDSRELAHTYLSHEAGNHFDPSRIDAFLENGPKMVEFFEAETSLQFLLGPTFSDYHPDVPGGLPGGRSIVAAPFDARELGSNIQNLRPPLREITFLGMMIGSGKELLHFFNVTRSAKSLAYVSGLLVRYARDLAFYGRGVRVTNGNALAARLAKSAFDAGVRILLDHPAERLLQVDNIVEGAVLRHGGEAVTVHARRGVVLACGGFPQDVERRKALFPHAPSGHEHWSPAPPLNTGDGLTLGTQAGGVVNDSLPHAAAWVPVSRVPRRDGTWGVFTHFVDRSKPGVIAVTRHGTRFVNEADSYHDFVQGMLRACKQDVEKYAFFICDHRTIRRYGLGYAKPAPVPLGGYVRSGYLLKGRTLTELASKAGIDPVAFEDTICRYNEGAVEGRDPEFGRGTNAYHISLGDPDHLPNPCVAPVATPPFYAVKVLTGDLGTFAGLKTDARARVLDDSGEAIPGLYAVGNDAASIMGGNYPGGGITLGPAMTFGYIAGRELVCASASSYDDRTKPHASRNAK